MHVKLSVVVGGGLISSASLPWNIHSHTSAPVAIFKALTPLTVEGDPSQLTNTFSPSDAIPGLNWTAGVGSRKLMVLKVQVGVVC